MASSVAISAPNAVLGIPRDVWGINSGVTEAADSTCSCTGWTFAHGDGVNEVFELPSLVSSLTSLYRRDWQGNMALSANPRTNYFLQSEDITYFGNNSGTPTKTVTTISDTSGSVSESGYKNSTVPVDSSQYAASLIIAKNAPNLVYVAWKFEGGTATNRQCCVIDTVTGNYKAWDVVTNTPVTCTVEDLGAAGWSVTLYPQNNGTNNKALLTVYPAYASSLGSVIPVNIVPSLTGSAGIKKIMLSPGVVRGSYIPTTTAPVTVTDYVASGNTITLAEAPLLGSDLSVDADLVPHTCLSFNHGGRR